MKNIKNLTFFTLLFVFYYVSYAQKEKPIPDLANIKYGEHERHVLDVWFANKGKTSPLVIFIHGGGFQSGSKDKLSTKELEALLDEGVSVAAINYRYKTIAPLPAAHQDARQALQFIRSNATKWNINKNKIGVFGGSAGAQICMWLAFSDEMAEPASKNPIKRESTRISCVATKGGQTTMESSFWLEHIGKYAPGQERVFNGRDRLQTFGVKTLEEADELAKTISALNLITADDPPIYMQYGMSPDATVPSNNRKARGWVVHHVDFGTALKEKMDALHVEADLVYPGSKKNYNSSVAFLVDKLLKN